MSEIKSCPECGGDLWYNRDSVYCMKCKHGWVGKDHRAMLAGYLPEREAGFRSAQGGLR